MRYILREFRSVPGFFIREVPLLISFAQIMHGVARPLPPKTAKKRYIHPLRDERVHTYSRWTGIEPTAHHPPQLPQKGYRLPKLLPRRDPLLDTQVATVNGIGVSQIMPMFSRTEMESMCTRDLNKTGTRGMRNVLKQREKKRDLVRSLPNDVIPRLHSDSIIYRSATWSDRVTTWILSRSDVFCARPHKSFGSHRSSVWAGGFHSVNHQLSITILPE